MNHFLECEAVTYNNTVAWTIHTGSRNFGQKVFKYWDKIANKPASTKSISKETINQIKEQYKHNKTEIPNAIKRVVEEYQKQHPMGYLTGEDMKGYLTDLFFCQAYAAWNHEIIKRQIDKIMLSMYGAKPVEVIQSVHNYVNPVDHIIRKGAISSYENQKMVIPFNMRDGIAICMGKSNPDWNFSAPHGAGRIMSRSKAKQNVSMDEFEKSMEGIYSTSVCTGTLDESPMAYKDMNEIVENIKDTVDILYLIKPIINLKATEGE